MTPASKTFRKKPCFWAFLAGLVLLSSCRERDQVADAVAKIPMDLEIARFDREFSKATPGELPALKEKYPYLFPRQYPDSIWVAKMTDTLQLELNAEVERHFGDFRAGEAGLESLFRHITYYFPDFEPPKVVTLVSDVRYQERVLLADTLLLIGLDNYLGKDHRFYGGLQRYIAASLEEKYLLSDVASAFSKTVLPYPNERSFLAKMVYYGKELYLKDRLLPEASDGQKIGYTPEEMAWAQANEEQMWRYFVERDLLYDTGSDLERKFLDPAPFSKFGLELDNESPGRLGRYVGWQIVRAYMERNDGQSLEGLLDMEAEELFKKSNYKPRN